MNTNKKEIGNLSSSSAFIIIIILVVVSVAAIVVGGGDGFSRKYAGIDFRDIAGQTLLAQTGVVGKNLKFEQVGGSYRVELEPIELDGEILGANEKYAAAVVPPLEGDSPFWYRTSAGSKRTPQGYPLRQDFVEANNLGADDVPADTDTIPTDIPGIVDCSISPNSGNGFIVFFEDIAYETGIGFDDAQYGEGRQDTVCETLQEFETLLRLDQDGLTPGIVVQSSEEGTPDGALTVVAPQYVGGSGFVSTLLADYLRTGERRSSTNFSDTVSTLGINSGFVRYNFDDTQWSVDTGDAEDFDLATVTRQNMLRLLGFGSFIGHEQENVLSSAWKRWTEWDRLLVTGDYTPLITAQTYNFYSTDVSGDNFDLGDADQYDVGLLDEGLIVWGDSLPDLNVLESFAYNLPEIKTFPSFQKGQSVSGLADPNAVSYPILEAGDIKQVSQAEKEILCMLGLSVEGLAGCSAPRTVVQNTYIERQNNQPVCVNLFDNVYNAFSNEFQLAGEMNLPQSVLENEGSFQMYTEPCPENGVFGFESKATYDTNHATSEYQEAVSFAWVPVGEPDTGEVGSEYVRFLFAVKDLDSNRVSDQGEITIHKCVVTENSNQICNGDFQFSSARSPIDFQLSTLEKIENVPLIGDFVGCQSTTAPGWCGQGTPDVYSSEFGYTWHPYLLENPEAFDQVSEESKKYAGGSSEVVIQRLRRPLTMGQAYTVSGKVYVQGGAQPTFFVGAPLKQSDGTYHMNYPSVLAALEDTEVERYPIDAYDTDEWVPFSLSLSVSQEISHVGFGGVGESGTVYFDDLSIQRSTECDFCPSDINGDCAVNASDLVAMLSSFTTSCVNETVGCAGDLNYDGLVNGSDLIFFLSGFGADCDDPAAEGENAGNEFTDGGGVFSPNFLAASEDDSSVSNSDIEVSLRLSTGEQVVPNAQGFESNIKVTIENNRNGAIDDLNIFGLLPNVLSYNSHVATEENIAFEKYGNRTIIPRLGRNETIDLYFNVDLEASVCGQVRRQAASGYLELVNAGLCDSYQEVLEKQYNIERDEKGNIIQKGSSRDRSSLPAQEDGELEGPPVAPECNDGIDNDGDGLIDLLDPDCSSKADTTESGSGSTPQCSDGVDNDADGRIDLLDPGCADGNDNDESR